MKLLKIYLHFLLIPALFSCKLKQDSRSECFNYPAQIDSLQIRDLYDTARWYLYSWLGDEKFDNFFKGECEMRYKSFFLQNDSIEIFFTLYEPDSTKKKTDRERISSYPSLAFNLKTREKLWGWDINGFSKELGPGEVRFENPRSPEILKFIKMHKEKLDPCFLELAKRMKVLNE